MRYVMAWILGVPFSVIVLWYIVGHAACRQRITVAAAGSTATFPLSAPCIMQDLPIWRDHG